MSCLPAVKWEHLQTWQEEWEKAEPIADSMHYQVWKHPLRAQFKVKYKITLLLSNSLGPKDDLVGLSFGQGMDFLLKYQCLSYCEMVYLAPPSLPPSWHWTILSTLFLHLILTKGLCGPWANQGCLLDWPMLILDDFIRLSTCSLLLLATNCFHLSWEKKGLVHRPMR